MAYTCQRAQALICDSEFTAADLQTLLKRSQREDPHDPSRGGCRPLRETTGCGSPGVSVRSTLFRNHLSCLSVSAARIRTFPVLSRHLPASENWAVTSHQLVIAGRAYRDYTLPEQTAARLGINETVRFLDHFPDTELGLLYQSADLLALLSFYEGFGLPILEAMASGTPIVASSGTSLPEVAGDAGLLVPPDDPLSAAQAFARLIPGGDARQTCIERGLERASNFTWERCARQTEAVYRKVIET